VSVRAGVCTVRCIKGDTMYDFLWNSRERACRSSGKDLKIAGEEGQ
jgi:hypothetical protein